MFLGGGGGGSYVKSAAVLSQGAVVGTEHAPPFPFPNLYRPSRQRIEGRSKPQTEFLFWYENNKHKK